MDTVYPMPRLIVPTKKWHVVDTTFPLSITDGYIYTIIDDDGNEIGLSDDKNNAVLMSMAPELLKALEFAMDNPDDKGFGSVLYLQQVVDRARGRE